ncbi:uroporphyrinogen-III C-methyltransferase [Aquabacterium sp. A7-Y]|uniref:uroporphyrinogen-III C-methyltransferase n=1 Tax=Aquabacterium sp. A7-Y TaxID=1349605 RepID=UPI00223CB4E0|nr:uroporphyrinogen-III C-methyltransferase [Aquabacterium sp. A7-Y]MCW7537572.1 uroporphyrinogen-III C-methyltransferase [Aquabacterium sp. A7-Y]
MNVLPDTPSSRAAARPTVTLVGAGPGDPELLTVKAIKAIRQASVLLVDDLVGEGVLRYARRGTRMVQVGKRGGCASTPQAFIERLMITEALKGERVVRLKGGDPFVFGRGGEEQEHLRAAGVHVEVVNGITSGLAAASGLGAPLTHRDHAHGVIFVTGHAKGETAELDWPQLAATAAQGFTLVIYMGVSQAARLEAGLLTALPADTPLAIVQHASLPQQRHALTRLGELQATLREEGLGSPAIIIVGEVLRGLAAAQADSRRPSAAAA